MPKTEVVRITAGRHPGGYGACPVGRRNVVGQGYADARHVIAVPIGTVGADVHVGAA